MRRVIFIVLMIGAIVTVVWALPLPTTRNNFFMPGSQPLQSGNLESANDCLGCHAYYDAAVEPYFQWQGSMMAHAARDPLFYAALAIANQDANGGGELCIRCHSPKAFLEGRSLPADGSALTMEDRMGVQCTVCHYMIEPSPIDVNPHPTDGDYSDITYYYDQAYLQFLSVIPPMASSSMYIIDASSPRRGPYTDAQALHDFLYSPFHRQSNLCGTCHDVSNPLFSKNEFGQYIRNPIDSVAESFNPYDLYPIERTYSEWSQSAYNTPTGVFAPQFGGNRSNVSTCQDCHMRDVTGYGCGIIGDERSDLGKHDLTGGNTVVPKWVAALYPDEVDTNAINSGILRALYMLQHAATLDLDVTEQGNQFQAMVRVTNETGHKLPTGYTEGRRMWVNLKAFNAANQPIYESGAYDSLTAVLTHDSDLKLYIADPGISPTNSLDTGIPAGPSFHFILNDTIYLDNRIPPRGFTNSNFAAVQAAPVGYSYADGQHWDDTYYTLPANTKRVETTLYYQTASKEYIDFLRTENTTNNTGHVADSLWRVFGKSKPVALATQSYVVPSRITDLTVLFVADTGDSLNFRLDWTAQAGATVYYIYQCNTPDCGSTTLLGSSATNEFHFYVTDDVNTPYKKFYFVVFE